MTLSKMAETAIDNHCRLALETLHGRFHTADPFGFSIVLTVNSGYE